MISDESFEKPTLTKTEQKVSDLILTSSFTGWPYCRTGKYIID